MPVQITCAMCAASREFPTLMEYAEARGLDPALFADFPAGTPSLTTKITGWKTWADGYLCPVHAGRPEEWRAEMHAWEARRDAATGVWIAENPPPATIPGGGR